jgi:predicted nucleic acid-binding protein
MRIAIDTSAIIAVVVNQAEKAKIIKATIDAELIAPASVKWEIGNALSAIYKRRKITSDEIGEALTGFNQIPVHFEHPDLSEALDLCVKHQIYAYDAYVLLCAKEFRVPLLTLDEAMRSIAGKEKIKLVEV